MGRHFLVIAASLAVFAAVGCMPSGQAGNGLTYEESESPADDGTSAAETTDQETVSNQGDTGSQNTEGDGDSEAIELAANSDAASEEGAGSDAAADSDTGEAAAEGPELTPEQQAAIDAIRPEMPFVDPWLPVGEYRAKRIGFDPYLDLEKVLNMTYIPQNAPDYFPDWLTELDGERVRIRGFMYTTFDGVQGFLLCRDLGPCCFGPNPRPDYRIPVTLRDGEVTDYIHQIPFDVEGTFHIHLSIDDTGRVSHVYAISEATIIRL